MTVRSQSQQLVVVTGASSGIGKATVHTLSQAGFHVLAGVRRDEDADAIRVRGVEPIILDITNPGHVAALARRVEDDPERRPLRAVVNNAGIGANAPVEVFDLDAWRQLFETNYFGHIAVTQALLRTKGRIINVSSVGGRIAMATYGPYGGTKWALEALSDSLRREVAPLGVDVVVIEPAAVKTKISGRAIATANAVAARMTHEQHQRYDGLVHAVTTQAAAADEVGLPASKVAKVIADAMTARRPRTRYALGSGASTIGILRLLPDRLVDRILAAALRRHALRAA